MILKSYFDGGNQADSKQYDVLTLAAVSGTHDEWVPFEKDWRKTLKKHGAEWLHTTDAISLADPFSRRKRWSEAKRDAHLMDCVRVAGRHIARQNRPNEPGRYGLYPFTVTVVLKDFIEARKVSPEVPTTATEACAVQALYACLEWGRENARAERYHLFFDQGEPYHGHIVDRKRNSKVLKQLPLLANITHSGEADMRLEPALQLADLYAWCVSHKAQDQGFKWQQKLLRMDRTDEQLTYDVLINPIPGVADLVKSWKLPRRRPTT